MLRPARLWPDFKWKECSETVWPALFNRNVQLVPMPATCFNHG